MWSELYEPEDGASEYLEEQIISVDPVLSTEQIILMSDPAEFSYSSSSGPPKYVLSSENLKFHQKGLGLVPTMNPLTISGYGKRAREPDFTDLPQLIYAYDYTETDGSSFAIHDEDEDPSPPAPATNNYEAIDNEGDNIIFVEEVKRPCDDEDVSVLWHYNNNNKVPPTPIYKKKKLTRREVRDKLANTPIAGFEDITMTDIEKMSEEEVEDKTMMVIDYVFEGSTVLKSWEASQLLSSL